MLLSASKASKFFGVSASTHTHSLRRWNKEDKIHASRLPSGQRDLIIETWLLTPFLLHRFVRFTRKIFKRNLFGNCNKALIKVSFASIFFSTFHFSFVSMLLTAAQASSTLGVSSCTLCRWHREGKITAFRSPSGVHLYDVSNILEPTASSPSPSPSFSSSTVTSLTSLSPNPTAYI